MRKNNSPRGDRGGEGEDKVGNVFLEREQEALFSVREKPSGFKRRRRRRRRRPAFQLPASIASNERFRGLLEDALDMPVPFLDCNFLAI